jgi:hypothetical protein
MSVPTGFDSRDAVAANPSVTNPPRPLRASRSQNNPVNCGFLDKPALLWTNRCGWPRNTALGPKSDRPLQKPVGRDLSQTHRRGRVMTKTMLPFLASVLLYCSRSQRRTVCERLGVEYEKVILSRCAVGVATGITGG